KTDSLAPHKRRAPGAPRNAASDLALRPYVRVGSADRPDVLREKPLRPLFQFELDDLPFADRLEAFAQYRGVMAEDVFAPLFLLDEAVALRVVEPLDRTDRHLCLPFGLLKRTRCSPGRSRPRHRGGRT